MPGGRELKQASIHVISGYSLVVPLVIEELPATVEALPDGGARVRFETPQSAVTPGQVVTVYQDDLVLGGGWIEGAIDVKDRGKPPRA